jgi:hypothetical protein
MFLVELFEAIKNGRLEKFNKILDDFKGLLSWW